MAARPQPSETAGHAPFQDGCEARPTAFPAADMIGAGPNPRPSVLLLGERERPEFATAVAWLHAHTRLTFARTPAALSDLEGDNTGFWDHVVIAQSRPGQFPQREVDRLSRHLPLAQFTALLGSACEGEPRSGRPWPGVVRVYWHQWSGRAPSIFLSARTGCRLPRTASEPERLDHALRTPPPRTVARVAICCPLATIHDALAVACRVAGYQIVDVAGSTASPASELAATLWYRSGMDARGFAALEQWIRHVAPAPVVALFGFPRYDQVRRAQSLGVAAVMSAPFLLPDLWNVLREVTG